MARVKTALIGLGYWGPNLLRNFSAQSDCEFVMACDLSPERIEKARAHFPAIAYTQSADDIFANPEIELVLIATPTATHATLATKALEAGKHVFVEKPMTATPEEAHALVACAKHADRLLMVDHTFVFAPAVQRMAEIAGNGTLGEPLYFESSRVNLGLIQKDTNVLFDLAIHDLSILHTVMDLRGVASIAAHGMRHFGEQIEQAHLHLRFASGFTAHIFASWLSPVKLRSTILAGTKAMILFDDMHPSEKLRIYDRGVEHDTSKPDPFFPKYRIGDILIPGLPGEETLSIEAKHVLACAQGHEQPLVSGEDAVRIIDLLHRANESIAQDGLSLSVS